METVDSSGRWRLTDPETYRIIGQKLKSKRQQLAHWMRETPPQKSRLVLGPAGRQAVDAHLRTLDKALEEAAEGALGRCEVCHDYVEADLLEMDYLATVCLSHFSEEELQQLERELELSSVVQRALLPQAPPVIAGVDIAAFSRPAQIVGGDYFDFLRFQDGAHGLAVGDVAGKGVSASLVMAGLQAALRAFVAHHVSPAAVLQELNRFVFHNVNFPTFVTLFLCRLETDLRHLSYANAGHNPPLFLRRAARDAVTVDWLPPTGAAVGLIEGEPVREESLRLETGDLLLLYTDGVTEATNPHLEEFGHQRLLELARNEANDPVGSLMTSLRQSIESFSAGQLPADDATIIVCKVNGQETVGSADLTSAHSA